MKPGSVGTFEKFDSNKAQSQKLIQSTYVPLSYSNKTVHGCSANKAFFPPIMRSSAAMPQIGGCGSILCNFCSHCGWGETVVVETSGRLAVVDVTSSESSGASVVICSDLQQTKGTRLTNPHWVLIKKSRFNRVIGLVVASFKSFGHFRNWMHVPWLLFGSVHGLSPFNSIKWVIRTLYREHFSYLDTQWWWSAVLELS